MGGGDVAGYVSTVFRSDDRLDTARRVPTKEQCSFYKNIFSIKLKKIFGSLSLWDVEYVVFIIRRFLPFSYLGYA